MTPNTRSVSCFGTALSLVFLIATAPVPAQESPGLVVAESGVGTSVVDRVLQGRAESFPEGTPVYFWTRITGGSAGDRLYHAWIHDGREVVIGLTVGGAHWRTYSNKMLHPGSAGDWAVEARDEAGAVLARHEFSCTP